MAFFNHRTKKKVYQELLLLANGQITQLPNFLKYLVALRDLRRGKSSRKRSQFYPYLPRQGCGLVRKLPALLSCLAYLVQDNIQQIYFVMSHSNIPAGLLQVIEEEGKRQVFPMSVTKLEAFCKGLQTKCVDLVLSLLTVRLQWLSLPEYVKRKKTP